MKKAQELLQEYELRVTPVRKELLTVLRSRNEAMPQPELVKVMEGFDRVTIYRTLASFEEKGLVHRIVNEQGVGNYALCSDACGPDHHHDTHVHLECTNCGKMYCLDDVEVPEIKIPARYKAHGLKIVTQGVCPSCQ